MSKPTAEHMSSSSSADVNPYSAMSAGCSVSGSSGSGVAAER